MALTAQQQSEINKSIGMQQDFQNKANDYTNQYNTAKGQANQAQSDIGNFNNYMQGAGQASNLYKDAFTNAQAQTGFSADTLGAAQKNVSQATGAQSAYNDYANTAASKWGMNAGALAAGNANAQAGLNNNVAAASTTLGTQQKAYDQTQNAASQLTGQGVQQQQTQLAGYKQAYDAAFSQQTIAQQNMTAYSKLAQDQGGLTAQQWQGYETANKLEAESKALMIQASAAMKSANAAMLQAQASSRQMNAQTDIANAQNDFMKQYQTGAYAKTPAAAPAAAPSNSNSGGINIGNWANGILNPIAQGAQAAGNWWSKTAGDTAHNLGWFGA